MNCTCISDIEKKVLTNLCETGKFKKTVKRVSLRGVVIKFGGSEAVAVTSNVLEIELDGQKKVETMNMLHSYCPFCGKKIEVPA